MDNPDKYNERDPAAQSKTNRVIQDMLDEGDCFKKSILSSLTPHGGENMVDVYLAGFKNPGELRAKYDDMIEIIKGNGNKTKKASNESDNVTEDTIYNTFNRLYNRYNTDAYTPAEITYRHKNVERILTGIVNDSYSGAMVAVEKIIGGRRTRSSSNKSRRNRRKQHKKSRRNKRRPKK